MNKNQIQEQLNQLSIELETATSMYKNIKEELEQFLSQFTCVLDAPSCGCSEEELNDPKFDALFTEQDRLTKLSKTWNKRIQETKEQISNLQAELEKLS